MAKGKLAIAVVGSDGEALRLKQALLASGVEAHVARRPWQGLVRPMVVLHLPEGQAEVLRAESERLGIAAEVLTDDTIEEQSLAVVAEFRQPIFSHLLRSALAVQGIDAFVTNDLDPGLLLESGTSSQVLVRRGDVKSARKVLQVLRHTRMSAEDLDTGELGDDGASPGEWPTCPHCKQPREAMCPKCQTICKNLPLVPRALWGEESPEPAAASDSSAQGATDAGGDPETAAAVPAAEVRRAAPQIRVICPMCDWLFRPQFPGRCPHCGHDFGDGPAAALGLDEPLDLLNLRAAGILLAIFAALLLVLGFYACILKPG